MQGGKHVHVQCTVTWSAPALTEARILRKGGLENEPIERRKRVDLILVQRSIPAAKYGACAADSAVEWW